MTDKAAPLSTMPPILFENGDLLACSKPAGMETISQTGAPDLTGLLRRLRREPGLVPAHRLDRDTSGAQLFARTAGAEQALADLFRHRKIGKAYLALCHGAPRNRSGRINRNLSEWSGGRRPVRVLKKGGLEAVTDYRVLAAQPRDVPPPAVGLVLFSPHHGRTHQIRVHAAALGHPILGDDQYGDRPANRAARERWGLRRSALHSWRLEIPWEGGVITVTAAPADDMRTAAEATVTENMAEILAKIYAAENGENNARR